MLEELVLVDDVLDELVLVEEVLLELVDAWEDHGLKDYVEWPNLKAPMESPG